MSRTRKEPHDADPLVEGVRDARRRQSGHGDDPSVTHRLAQIGVLGWIIVTPMLLAIFLGRWLDRLLGTGIFWTAPLLLLGLVLGGWSAWKWMNAA